MKSIADQLPPEIAGQIHPDRRRNEAAYWVVRDQLLQQYHGQWIGFADGRVIASGNSPVAVFHAAEASGEHPFLICVGKEEQPCRIRRVAFHFVEFWAERYRYPNDDLYTQNINAPRTPDSLGKLFKWKIGNKLFRTKCPHVKQHFIDRLDQAERLLKELAGLECRDIAQRFLDHFKDGGAIYRIFWLHCLNTRILLLRLKARHARG